MYNRCIIPEIQIKSRGTQDQFKDGKQVRNKKDEEQNRKDDQKEKEKIVKKEKKIKFIYVKTLKKTREKYTRKRIH